MKKAFFLLFLCCLITTAGSSDPLQSKVKAEAAIVIDLDTGEILFARHPDMQLYPASLTKLLTALLLAENSQQDDLLVYSAAAKAVYPYKLDLAAGDQMYARDAMDAILMFSANDIAWMVAENIGGDAEVFTAMMNNRAAALGLQHSHFQNPHGLHDENHYSTAYNLSLILRAMYRSPRMMASTCRKEQTITTLGQSRFTLINRNKLILSAGCIGGKTGWTPEAGRCLAALFERSHRHLAAVVLKSEYDPKDTVVFDDMLQLIDWACDLKPAVLYEAGTVVRTVRMPYKVIPLLGPVRQLDVPVLVRQTVAEYTADPDLILRSQLRAISPWKLNLRQSIGELQVTGREICHTYALYPGLSAADLLRQHRVLYGLLVGLVCLILLLVILFIRFMKKRRDVLCSTIF